MYIKKNKFALISMLTAILVSFNSNAEDAAPDMGGGVVNFKGSVVAAPCGIDPGSVEQTIDFGEISSKTLAAGGNTVQKNLDIKLINCEIDSTHKLTNGVKIAFLGHTKSGHTQELGTAGETGTAIMLSDGVSPVSFDGTPSTPTKIMRDNETLHYTAWVKKASDGVIKEGSFTATADFALSYE
ncbi:TPA: type 1 fimbrial protein [Escherichia coli]|uniref:fimbrial protein n=1 Tax=Escherichia coli TaxID=562 RepID=UPI0010CBD330|nr:fimbrial protein [Escherichia coli]GDA12264.1 major pilin protein PapA [Escherichia coli]HAX5303103.1 type 1 fimbrial protein [Escherichia coli]